MSVSITSFSIGHVVNISLNKKILIFESQFIIFLNEKMKLNKKIINDNLVWKECGNGFDERLEVNR